MLKNGEWHDILAKTNLIQGKIKPSETQAARCSQRKRKSGSRQVGNSNFLYEETRM